MRIRDGRGFKEARAGDGVKLIFPTGTESCGRVQHCIAPTLMAGPVVGVVVAEPIPGRERERGQLIQVATLDKTSYPRIEMCRRVYSPDGIAPTIHTCGGGGTEPKILVGGERVRIKTANSQGWMEGRDGDGVVLNFLGRARGVVREKQSPTLQTDGGGEFWSDYDE